MAWEDIEWGKVLVGVVSAAGTIYAAREQRNAQQKQFDFEQKILDEQRQYQQDKVSAAQNTPMAKMAPILMQSVLQLYGDKLKKFGVDLPMDQLLAALGMGSGSTLQNAMSGGGASARTLTPEEEAAKDERINSFAAKFGGLADGTSNVAARMASGRGGSRVQRREGSIFGGGDAGLGSNVSSGAPSFDTMFDSQHEYMKSQGLLQDSLITPEQMANWNLSAREFGNAHPLADKAGQYLVSALLGAAVPGPSVPGMGKGVYNQFTKGSNENITDVYGDTNAAGLPVTWINGIPQYGDARLGG